MKLHNENGFHFSEGDKFARIIFGSWLVAHSYNDYFMSVTFIYFVFARVFNIDDSSAREVGENFVDVPLRSTRPLLVEHFWVIEFSKAGNSDFGMIKISDYKDPTNFMLETEKIDSSLDLTHVSGQGYPRVFMLISIGVNKPYLGINVSFSFDT